VSLLPVLGPGVAEGFAAGILVCAACLLIVIALQRAGRQEAGLLRPWRLSGPGTSRWRRAAARLAGRTGQTWQSRPAVPRVHTEDATTRPPARRRGGKHAARLAGSTRIPSRRYFRLLSTRN
jgi:hypothetical protein